MEKGLEDYKNSIIENMKSVGTYKDEFLDIIDSLAKIYYDYDDACYKFKQSGSNFMIKHTNKSGATNIVKNPYYLVIEGLRQNILSYSRELGLTPAGLKKINDEFLPVRRSVFRERSALRREVQSR